MIKNLLTARIKSMSLLQKAEVIDFIDGVSRKLLTALKENKRILICGNGGSAAQSSHLVTELTVKYKNRQNHFNAISLCADVARLTAAANDYFFDDVFSMQVENYGKKGDLLVVLSTSGNSKNIVKALEKANEKEMETVAFLGKGGGECLRLAKLKYVDESLDSAIIQEHHLVLIHLICEVIENQIL